MAHVRRTEPRPPPLLGQGVDHALRLDVAGPEGKRHGVVILQAHAQETQEALETRFGELFFDILRQV